MSFMSTSMSTLARTVGTAATTVGKKEISPMDSKILNLWAATVGAGILFGVANSAFKIVPSTSKSTDEDVKMFQSNSLMSRSAK